MISPSRPLPPCGDGDQRVVRAVIAAAGAKGYDFTVAGLWNAASCVCAARAPIRPLYPSAKYHQRRTYLIVVGDADKRYAVKGEFPSVQASRPQER